MTDYIQLTSEQQNAIDSNKDTIVVANPGTGKTTTLAFRVIRLLRDGINPDDILCITFTNKAKKEMYNTIHKYAQDEFQKALKVHIHTFHNFAYNYLIDGGLMSSLIADTNLLRFSVLQSLVKNDATHYPKDYIISKIVPDTAKAITYIKNFKITPKDIDISKTSSILEKKYKNMRTKYTLEELEAFLNYFTKAYFEYETAKQDSDDYTDILLKFLEKFDGRKYEHALIDEMQDMNKIQAEIAQKVANIIFLVGDQKQAIFGFQGGSSRHADEFESRCTRMQLSGNNRSTDKIVNYAKQHYLNGINPDKKVAEDLEKFRSTRDPKDIPATASMPKVISTSAPLSKMIHVIKDSSEENIGIIARTNKQVATISEFLDKNRIPHTATASNTHTTMAKKEIINFLTGLLYDDMEKKIRSTFTVFSPYTLRESFEFSCAFKESEHAKLKKLEMWGADIKVNDLDDLFNHTILPICISKGNEWFDAAMSIKQNIAQYWELNTPTLDEFFDYLEVCEEPPTEQKATINKSDSDKTISVSTIHKAKGQEFDSVIYWPKDTDKSNFIDEIKSAILESSSINVQDELDEEQMRMHFVALTRAKNELVIITDDKRVADFHIKGLSDVIIDDASADNEEKDKDTQAIDAADASILEEAYSLFVTGRMQDSQDILQKRKGGDWIEKTIEKYFENMDSISPSKIKTAPSEFMKYNIMNIHTSNSGMRFGNMFHNAIENLVQDDDDGTFKIKHTAAQDYDPATSGKGKLTRALQNATSAINELSTKYPGLQIYLQEEKFEIPLKHMTAVKEADINITFKGKIDAVFKHNTGYLLIDYKTDKNTNYLSDHRKQLAAYKRILSYAKDIPEDSIDTCVIFVSQTGSINTDKVDYETSKTNRDAYPRFEADLQKILDWKHDYKMFINDLLEENKDKDDVLNETIKERLAILNKQS